ncbi:MAG: NAD(P)/FAD-dependent oxidoreductase, partial [Vicinamibacterales bacterium]
MVIGAGPAGLSAASALARERAAVLVLEEHGVVGDPVHCTGVLGLEAFDELELPRHTICAVARTARFHGRDGRSVDVDGGRIAAAVVDRGRFDRALSERAVNDGATVVCGARVLKVAVGDRDVSAFVEASGARPQQVRARVCILACGAQYRFNRQLGLGIPRAYVQTAQIETAFTPATVVEIDLNREIAPGGFAWLVPFQRGDAHMARIGLMATEGAAGGFKRYTESIARRHGVATVGIRPRLKILPLGPVKRTYTDRILAVGDAAGLAKPTTGGGIYYSLLSGLFAAETLTAALKHDRTDAGTLRAYETLWQARLGPELRAGLAFRTLAARLDDRAIDALLELAAVDGIIPILKRTGDFNWHREAALALLRNAG